MGLEVQKRGKLMNKLIINIEGPDKAGKDYFIKFLKQKFPLFVYYASGNNFFDFNDEVKKYAYNLTYSTIFKSIENSSINSINIIYRSIFTDFIYNLYYNRIKLIKPLNSYFSFLSSYDIIKSSEFIVLLPNKNILESRFLKEKDLYLKDILDYEKIINIYHKIFDIVIKKGYNVLYCNDPISQYNKIQDFIISKLPNFNNIVLYDIDGTSNSFDCSKYYLTGRFKSQLNEYQEDHVVYNPYEHLPLFKSSRLFKLIVLDTLYNSKRYQSIEFIDDRKDIINLYIDYLFYHNYKNIEIKNINNLILLKVWC